MLQRPNDVAVSKHCLREAGVVTPRGGITALVAWVKGHYDASVLGPLRHHDQIRVFNVF